MLRLGLAAQRLLPVQQALRALVQLPHGAPEACAPSTSYSTKPAQNKDVRYTIGNNLDSLVKIVDPYQGPLKLSGWNILANNNAGIMQLEKAAHHFSKKWWTAFMCLRSIKGFTLLGLRANALDAHVAMNEAVARGISEGSMEPELHARLQKQLTQTMYHGLQANIANFRRAGWHRVDYKLARDPVIADVEVVHGAVERLLSQAEVFFAQFTVKVTSDQTFAAYTRKGSKWQLVAGDPDAIIRVTDYYVMERKFNRCYIYPGAGVQVPNGAWRLAGRIYPESFDTKMAAEQAEMQARAAEEAKREVQKSQYNRGYVAKTLGEADG